jgi:hypothetical protein
MFEIDCKQEPLEYDVCGLTFVHFRLDEVDTWRGGGLCFTHGVVA